MKRTLEEELKNWKDREKKIPLIVRGARQIGKSYLVEEFGNKNFSNVVVANFEEKSYLSACFETLEVDTIVQRISQLTNEKIIPGETLIFFDEIQNCLPALKALRYFKEKMPELHVIAAGSFLEFVLEDEKEISFPVGRVQFLNMRPMSFMEYLQAVGQKGLCKMITTVSLTKPFPNEIHQRLLNFVRDYFMVGGMPSAVDLFAIERKFTEVRKAHASILESYRLDLGKYGKKSQYRNLDLLFRRAPALAGIHFKYKNIDPESPNPARDYKYSLRKLDLARVIHLVHRTKAKGIPLQAQADEKRFKLFFLDIGLLQHALGIDPVEAATSPLLELKSGVLAEQFVAQELLAYLDPYIDKHLYYWDRKKIGGEAEIDFVINLSGKIIPIEVKAGKTGTLKSLRHFLDTHPVCTGVKISESNLSHDKQVLSIPFYLISQIERILGEVK